MSTIRRRLTRKLLWSFLLLLGLGGVGIYLAIRGALLEQFDATLLAKAEALTAATEQNAQRIKVEIPDDFMSRSDDGMALDWFQLWRGDGTTVRRSKSLGNLDLAAPAGLAPEARFWNLTLPSGARGRAIGYAFRPRTNGRSDTATAEPVDLVLAVASDRRELDETLTALAFVLLGCGALLLVTTVVVVPRVLRRELAPLDQLADQAGCITADSLATRFPTATVPGELQPISERLNQLLAGLERAFERERRFSADLAHELRTPIAELRSLADLALKWPETRPPDLDRDTLAIAVQMEGIVVRLLELLRSERGQITPACEDIALAPLVEGVWRPFADKAAEKGLVVNRHVPDATNIKSDPVLLRSILTNLVENAVDYTPRGGTISIEGSTIEGRFTLRVENTTERFEPADVASLFDRFWRKDPARSGSQHSGLGLSLAQGFARTLGCELTATLNGESRLALLLSGPSAFTVEGDKTSSRSTPAR
jgi:two-component system sensor histidine kinase QseC